MSLNITVKHYLGDGQIQGLYQLFLYSISADKVNPTKKAFMEYVRTQVVQFGDGDYLLGSSVEDGDYPPLTPDGLNQLMLWGLI